MSGKKQLSLFEAAAIIAGLGVGGGVMAVPYLASLSGFLNFVWVMLLAYLVSAVLHLMIAEIVIRDGRGNQLVEVLGKYLFTGLPGLRRVFIWIFFALIVISFYALLAGYIVGAGEILVELAGLPLWAAELVFYGVAAGVVFFGLKALGLSEKYTIVAAAVILAVLAGGSLFSAGGSLSLYLGVGKETMALYGMVMFCFASFFSIPQAREGLSWNTALMPRAVLLGLGINFCLPSPSRSWPCSSLPRLPKWPLSAGAAPSGSGPPWAAPSLFSWPSSPATGPPPMPWRG